MAYDLDTIHGPERDRYMRRILEDRDSLVPRLDYADWFERNGCADRAKFIRYQCSDHDLTTALHGNTDLQPEKRNRLDSIRKLERDLWKAHQKEWREMEDPPAGTFVDPVDWENGLPYFAKVKWKTVDKEALRNIMSNYPLQGLVVQDISASDLEAFLQEPWVSQLRHLILQGNQIGNEGVRAIAASENLRKLQYLNLEQCGIELEGAQVLAASKNLRGLRVLRLRGNNITLQGVYALAEASQTTLPNLWKIMARGKLDSHDAQEFYGNIDEDMMGKNGFTERLEGGQVWEKRNLRSSGVLLKPEQSPEEIQNETMLRLKKLLTSSSL